MKEQSHPQKLSDFKNLAAVPDQYAIPEVPQKRSTTDKFFLIFFIICNIILFIFLTYSLIQSDYRRKLHGYDPCGNVCGQKNDHVDGLNCSGKDFTDAPYLRYPDYQPLLVMPNDVDDTILEFTYRECVEDCDKNTEIIIRNRCFLRPDNSSDNFELISDETTTLETKRERIEKIYESSLSSTGSLTMTIVVAIAMVLTSLAALRYATAAVVWTMTIGGYLLLVILTLMAWFCNTNDKDMYIAAIALSILTLILTYFIVTYWKKIPLIIAIFKEAMKAIFTMPTILLHSFLSFVSLFIATILLIVTLSQLSYAEVLTKYNDDFYIYEPNGVILFAIFLDLLMYLWYVFFINGCQVMVVSGAISSWYFTRDKTFLGSPIRDSFANLLKYHLGTVAFGSLVLTVIEILRAILRALSSNSRTAWLVKCCLNAVQDLAEFLCYNAYLMVAMHGESFARSGKRAVQLIYWNLNDVIGLNVIRSLVIFMLELAVSLLTVLITVFIHDSKSESYTIAVSLGGLFALMIAHSTFRIIKIAIDTILLCYCEDMAINDGLERPYYMTTDLMLFFEESRNVLGDTKPKPVDECQDI